MEFNTEFLQFSSLGASIYRLQEFKYASDSKYLGIVRMVDIRRPNRQLCDQLSKLAEILSWIEPRLDGVALGSWRLHFSSTQFSYQGLVRLDQNSCRPNGWSDAHNFHTWSLSVRTMKTVVQTIEFWMHDLPYEWARPDGNTHRPNGCNYLPISVFLDWNPMADQTLNDIQTCCWNVRTDATWNSLKLLDIEEGPDGKFLSSRQMSLGQLNVRTV